ncbi:hypothetical protein HYH03_012079 [Edaphochlamys debaryana]|uniref:Uncharacterized protein n=1 Tax=Edaphochlamys debaryana TaxID=47281 RepID=A0A835XUV6_9CHLO|nr:hypothetical protein HYH03_012079 [Edaphochlamys debaryana]|eukprot:KAG2489443.1 hypothetical protein HYH03_012079 [Edaphochlamys debaryana]
MSRSPQARPQPPGLGADLRVTLDPPVLGVQRLAVRHLPYDEVGADDVAWLCGGWASADAVTAVATSGGVAADPAGAEGWGSAGSVAAATSVSVADPAAAKGWRQGGLFVPLPWSLLRVLGFDTEFDGDPLGRGAWDSADVGGDGWSSVHWWGHRAAQPLPHVLDPEVAAGADRLPRDSADAADAARAMGAKRLPRVLGFDTEFIGDQLALLQLCAGDRALLIRVPPVRPTGGAKEAAAGCAGAGKGRGQQWRGKRKAGGDRAGKGPEGGDDGAAAHPYTCPPALAELLRDPKVPKAAAGAWQDALMVFAAFGVKLRGGLDLALTVPRSDEEQTRGRQKLSPFAIFATFFPASTLAKDKAIDHSKWFAISLREQQLRYAAFDAFVSYAAGVMVQRRDPARLPPPVDLFVPEHWEVVMAAQWVCVYQFLEAQSPQRSRHDFHQATFEQHGKGRCVFARGKDARVAELRWAGPGGRDVELREVSEVREIEMDDPSQTPEEEAMWKLIPKVLMGCESFAWQHWLAAGVFGGCSLGPPLAAGASTTASGAPFGVKAALWVNRQVNSSQRTAIEEVLYGSSAVTLVQGPPGTGKTTVISRVVELWLDETGNNSYCAEAMACVARSNVAARNIALALIKRGLGPKDFRQVVSQEFHFEWHEEQYRGALEQVLIVSDQMRNKAMRQTLRDVKVFVTTISMLTSGGFRDKALDGKALTRLLVDEASQIYAGDLVLPLHVFGEHLRSLALFGDDMQLPPYGSEWDGATQPSPFDHLTPPAGRTAARLRPQPNAIAVGPELCAAGGGVRRIMLDVSYRLPPSLCSFIGEHMYGGLLRCGRQPSAEPALTWVDVRDGMEESRGGTSLCNPREAQAVLDVVRQSVLPTGLSWTVLTGYDLQRSVLDKLISAQPDLARHREGGGGGQGGGGGKQDCARVYNIDTFQGREDCVVVVSTVKTGRSLGFMRDDRRVNVMLTRCTHRLVVVGSLATALTGPAAAAAAAAVAGAQRGSRQGSARPPPPLAPAKKAAGEGVPPAKKAAGEGVPHAPQKQPQQQRRQRPQQQAQAQAQAQQRQAPAAPAQQAATVAPPPAAPSALPQQVPASDGPPPPQRDLAVPIIPPVLGVRCLTVRHVRLDELKVDDVAWLRGGWELAGAASQLSPSAEGAPPAVPLPPAVPPREQLTNAQRKWLARERREYREQAAGASTSAPGGPTSQRSLPPRVLGFDTEFDLDQLALLQLCAGDRALLIRVPPVRPTSSGGFGQQAGGEQAPSAASAAAVASGSGGQSRSGSGSGTSTGIAAWRPFTCPAALAELLCDPTVPKAAAEAGQDALMVFAGFGVKLRGGLDLTVAVPPSDEEQKRGRRKLSLFEIFARLFPDSAITKDKTVDYSQWFASSLSEQQLRYAALDAFVSYAAGVAAVQQRPPPGKLPPPVDLWAPEHWEVVLAAQWVCVYQHRRMQGPEWTRNGYVRARFKEKKWGVGLELRLPPHLPVPRLGTPVLVRLRRGGEDSRVLRGRCIRANGQNAFLASLRWAETDASGGGRALTLLEVSGVREVEVQDAGNKPEEEAIRELIGQVLSGQASLKGHRLAAGIFGGGSLTIPPPATPAAAGGAAAQPSKPAAGKRASAKGAAGGGSLAVRPAAGSATAPRDPTAAVQAALSADAQVNGPQRTAIEEVLYGSSAVTLVQGPPVTGKTTVISRVVELWLQHMASSAPTIGSQRRAEAMACVARSNVAARNIALALIKRGLGPKDFRLVLPHAFLLDWHEEPYRGTLEQVLMIVNDTHMELLDVKVFVTTTSMLTSSTFQQAALHNKVLTRLLVDEASQIYAGDMVLPLHVFGEHLRSLALFGDHVQLPPYGSEWDGATQPSPFDHLTPPAGRAAARLRPQPNAFSVGPELCAAGGGVRRIMLEVSYRLPPSLCAFISQRMYGGMLRSGRQPSAEPALTWVDVRDGMEESRGGASLCNPREAQAVLDVVRQSVLPTGLSWTVLTGYDLQRSVLDKLISAQPDLARHREGGGGGHGGGGKQDCARVYNIDTFQGREDCVVVASCVKTGRSLGFMRDDRRVNVMLTRCTHRLIVVGSLATALSEPDTLLCRLATHCVGRGLVREA